jgi:hypothetical protein
VAKSKQDKPELEDEGSTRDGAENGGGSLNDRSAEIEAALPEPAPLGDKRGTIPFPGTAPQSAKKNVEIVVELTKTHSPGAGQLDINKEHLLLVRAEYLKGTPTPKRDGEKRVIGFKYVQQLRPTWTESLEDYLRLNGLKIVRVDEKGDALDIDALSDVEALRLQQREKEGALD